MRTGWIVLIIVCEEAAACRPTIAGDTPRVVSNVGRFKFDALPHESVLGWNLDNYNYPPGALTVEDLGGGNRALRIGRADGSQTGRCTMTLRASTHGWDPSQPGANHAVSVRFAARYRGAAFVAVSSPGGGALVDIGNGRLKLWQRMSSRDELVDETEAVQATLADKWDAGNLHTYTLEWRTTSQQGRLPFRLLVDGKLVKDFAGHERPSGFDPTL